MPLQIFGKLAQKSVVSLLVSLRPGVARLVRIGGKEVEAKAKLGWIEQLGQALADNRHVAGLNAGRAVVVLDLLGCLNVDGDSTPDSLTRHLFESVRQSLQQHFTCMAAKRGRYAKDRGLAAELRRPGD